MIYTFNEYIVHEPRRQLLRDGTLVPTEPKVFDVLVFLIRNRDRVISRQELLDACWPGIHVCDGSLSRCLSRIRNVIGQHRTANEPIQTYHGRGYRFVGDVQVDDTDGQGDGEPAAIEVTPVHFAPATRCVAERRVVSIVDVHVGQEQPDADPEALYEALRGFSAACARSVAGLPCSMAQHSQSCERLAIHVGYPQAAENPAAVAVAVGHTLMDRAIDLGLTVTITIASGWAIVGPGADGTPLDHLLIGIDPILKSSLDHVAADGRLIADAATVGLLDGRVPATHAVTVSIDGKPQKLFTLGRPAAVDPLHAGATEPPFVGRDWELMHLNQRWQRAAAGTGQIVLLTGEPGIGKSRLVQELLGRIGALEDRVLHARGCHGHRHTPLFPLQGLLRRLLGIDPAMSVSRQLAVIQARLEAIGDPEPDYLPHLAAMLSLAVSDHEPAQERLLEALLFVICAHATSGPAIFWVDDLQWADRATLAVLEQLAARIAGLPMLLVLCSRSDHHASLPEEIGKVTNIVLGPLSRSLCTRLLSEYGSAEPFSDKLIEEIAERSDGVPLYLKEIVRMAAARPAGATAVPYTLQGLLASRLDQAGDAKTVAQWAAVIGRSFSRDLLARVTGCGGDDLDRCLAALVEAGIVLECRRGEACEFCFNHGLVRDAVYQSLLLRTRRAYHRRIADVLVEQFPHIAATEPEQVARHHAAADDPANPGDVRQAVSHTPAVRPVHDKAPTPYPDLVRDAARTNTATPDGVAFVA